MPLTMQALLRLPPARAAGTGMVLRHASIPGAPFSEPFFGNHISHSFLAPTRRWRPPFTSPAAVKASLEPTVSPSDDSNETSSQEEYIAECQQHFTIPGLVDVSAGPGGLPFVTLRHPSGSQARLCLHGATVTSWTSTDGTEAVYLRENNKFDGIQPIAGGISIAWPQIGPGVLPLHGLLRMLHWSVVETSAWEENEDPQPTVSLFSDSTADGAQVWPHSFEAVYSVSLEAAPPPRLHPRDQAQEIDALLDSLSEDTQRRHAEERRQKEQEEALAAAEAAATASPLSLMPTAPPPPEIPPPSVLRCTLQIHNNGEEAFKFTSGLLTHLATEDIRENKKFVKVLGLGGKYALDFALDPMRPQLSIQQGDFLFFDPDSGKNVDKLYVDCDNEGHILFCPGTQRHLEVTHPRGFTDLEVLHPAASAPDVARRCVCLGSARKARPVTLAPGETWVGEMVVKANNEYWALPPFEKADPTTIPVPRSEEALPPRQGTRGEEFAYIDELNQ